MQLNREELWESQSYKVLFKIQISLTIIWDPKD